MNIANEQFAAASTLPAGYKLHTGGAAFDLLNKMAAPIPGKGQPGAINRLSSGSMPFISAISSPAYRSLNQQSGISAPQAGTAAATNAAKIPGSDHDPLGLITASSLGAMSKQSAKDMTGLADHKESAEMEARRAELTKQAQKFVAQIFYGTMFKQMRNDPFRSKLFDGGRGGQAFGGLYDEKLSERMAGARNNKLVKSLVRSLAAKDPKLGGGHHKSLPVEKANSALNAAKTIPGPLATPPTDNPFKNVRIHVAPDLGH